ncbi:MAG: 3-oxoacyl-ACP synthase III, partial [Puniceicoccaceae bacterium]
GDTAGQGLQMQTDSELLLEAGVALAARTWEAFGKEIGWAPEGPDRFICHQVGAAHRRRICEALGLDPERDYSTFDHLGNMGSASLPVTLAEAAEKGVVAPGHRIALLGIGSGIHCLMLGVEWGSGGHG